MKILWNFIPRKLISKLIKYLLLHKKYHDFDQADSKMEVSLENELRILILQISNVLGVLHDVEDNLYPLKKTF
jgi:hypothetical protein